MYISLSIVTMKNKIMKIERNQVDQPVTETKLSKPVTPLRITVEVRTTRQVDHKDKG